MPRDDLFGAVLASKSATRRHFRRAQTEAEAARRSWNSWKERSGDACLGENARRGAARPAERAAQGSPTSSPPRSVARLASPSLAPLPSPPIIARPAGHQRCGRVSVRASTACSRRHFGDAPSRAVDEASSASTCLLRAHGTALQGRAGRRGRPLALDPSGRARRLDPFDQASADFASQFRSPCFLTRLIVVLYFVCSRLRRQPSPPFTISNANASRSRTSSLAGRQVGRFSSRFYFLLF